MVGRTRHVSEARLTDLAEARLSDEERERAMAHISDCEQCMRDLQEYQRLVDLMRTDRGQDAPPAVIAGARQLFERRSKPETESVLQRLLAVLRFDSLHEPRAIGVRAGGSATRHLLFSAGNYDLDLRISERGGLWTVEGQVLGPFDEGEVEVTNEIRSIRAMVSSLGEFVLPPVPAGHYAVQLTTGPVVIAVEDLEIGP